MTISDAIKKWWPLPHSLDLVQAPADEVASAVLAEVNRFTRDVDGEQPASGWVPFATLDDVFGSVSVFTNVPTVFFVLPAWSDWSVLWNNSFLCDGYDSLCWCLTNNHALTTMHWGASDKDAVFQAGSSFTFRMRLGGETVERSVYCGKNDTRWHFEAVGKSLPEEHVDAYSAIRKRDRLNEAGMLALLARMGARPWDERFYRTGQAFRIERVALTRAIPSKSFAEVALHRQ